MSGARQTATPAPVRRLRAGALACLGLVAALAAAAPAAAAQDAGDRPSVLLVLDASRSMNAPAGDGSGSRMDAAKAAIGEVLDTVPAEAALGLRVYGARVAGQGKAKACADTELVAPVEAGDRGALRDAVAALTGKGRTPIGRSLLATPGDFPDDRRRHQVILVSDGLDNCAPPSPCSAARRVARRGVELTISVVGFALDAQARRQMRCIARVGGGTYVDAGDIGRLREELLAAFARAFRGYEPSGTRADGAPGLAAAPRLGDGLYQGELRSKAPQTFAVELAPGQRLFAAGTLIVPADLGAGGTFRVALLDPDGEELDFDQTGFGTRDTVTGLTTTLAQRSGAAGLDIEPGTYGVQLTVESDELGAGGIPFELAVEALEPDARPGLVREPGPEPVSGGDPEPTPTPTPAATATPEPEPEPEDGGGDAPVLAGVAVGGLLSGFAGGFALRRRRRA